MKYATQKYATHVPSDAASITEVLDASRTQSGRSLGDLCNSGPVLLVFLRHAGCTFCRETLDDIAQTRSDIEKDGIRIVLVHMGDAEALRNLLHKNGLDSMDRIHDPSQRLYNAFGLKRGTFLQLFGWNVIARAIFDGALFRHGVGFVSGDPTQMPGIFLIRDGEIERRFRHRTAADRADFAKICAPGQ
ncbi:MAG: peroxiredoxin-like family protein [Bryobacteraceae bacterium]